jgi:DnaK suppressor protein
MTPQLRETLRRRLVTALAETEKEIADLGEKTAPIAPDCSLGRLTRLEAMGEQQVSEHALAEARIRLNRLKYALSRIDRDDYGICEECEEAIPAGRLEIMPEATLCVDCANEKGR